LEGHPIYCHNSLLSWFTVTSTSQEHRHYHTSRLQCFSNLEAKPSIVFFLNGHSRMVAECDSDRNTSFSDLMLGKYLPSINYCHNNFQNFLLLVLMWAWLSKNRGCAHRPEEGIGILHTCQHCYWCAEVDELFLVILIIFV